MLYSMPMDSARLTKLRSHHRLLERAGNRIAQIVIRARPANSAITIRLPGNWSRRSWYIATAWSTAWRRR